MTKKVYRDIEIDSDIKAHFLFTFDLSVADHNLKVGVSLDGNKSLTYNSSYDNISFWDLYDTQERIVSSIENKNVDIKLDKEITFKDKPLVERDSATIIMFYMID